MVQQSLVLDLGSTELQRTTNCILIKCRQRIRKTIHCVQCREHTKLYGFAPIVGEWKILDLMSSDDNDTLLLINTFWIKEQREWLYTKSKCFASCVRSIWIKKLEVGYCWNMAWIRSWFQFLHKTIKSSVHWCSEQLRWLSDIWTQHNASVISSHAENTANTSNQRAIHNVT